MVFINTSLLNQIKTYHFQTIISMLKD